MSGRLTLLLLLIGLSAHAQISMVQDSEGESSIMLANVRTINVNFAASKITLASYLFGTEKHSLSAQGSFSAADGVSKIFDGSQFSPEATIGLTYLRFVDLSNDNHLGYWFASGSVIFANHKLYDSLGTFENVIVSKREQSYSLLAGYNWTNQDNLALGFAVHPVFSSNNFDQLDDYTIATTVIRSNANGTQSKTISGDIEEVKGKYDKYRNDLSEATISSDLLWWPCKLNSTVAFGLHGRANFLQTRHPVLNGGIGVYVTGAGADDPDPTSFVGGIVFEHKDFFAQRADADHQTFKSRTVVSLVVGYTFKLE